MPSGHFDIWARTGTRFCLPSPFVIRPTFLVSTDQQPDERAIEICVGVVRLEVYRLAVARQRLVETLQLRERNASVVEGFCVVRPKGNRLVVAGQRLVETLQLLERIASVVEGFYVVRFEGNRLVVAGERLSSRRFSSLSALARLLLKASA